MKYHRPTTRRQHFALETLKKKDGYMILERVESEHIETAEEIVFTIFVLVRILFVFTKMET